ncbi:hypothetical protein Tco_0694913 [Tanacetum coccineum]
MTRLRRYVKLSPIPKFKYSRKHVLAVGSTLALQGITNLIHTLLTCMVDSVANELSFLVLGKRIRFRRQEFCLVTGLRFGRNMYMKEWVKNMADNSFRNRIFPDIEARSVKLSDVIAIFDKMRDGSLVLEDTDVHLSNCWNIFPWGSYIWEHTYPKLRDALGKRKGEGEKKEVGVLHVAERDKQMIDIRQIILWAYDLGLLKTGH